MEWFVRSFIKASLTWLGLGVTMGLSMAVHPVWTVYRTAHLHMTILGFMVMMIYGFSYHVIPRLSGHPLPSPRLAGVQWWLANIGLVFMVIGFLLRPHGVAMHVPALILGGVLVTAGAYIFIYNIWGTIRKKNVVQVQVVQVKRG